MATRKSECTQNENAHPWANAAFKVSTSGVFVPLLAVVIAVVWSFVHAWSASTPHPSSGGTSVTQWCAEKDAEVSAWITAGAPVGGSPLDSDAQANFWQHYCGYLR
jgi:hypothetical protein